MPSSHAQFVTFFSIYLMLFLLIRHEPHPTKTHTPLSFIERLLLSIAALYSAAAVAASRVYLNYHTPKQVLVGCSAGAFCAVCWFIATALFRKSGLLDWLIDTRLARMLRMRDLVVMEDLVDAGWARWDATRRKRSIQEKKTL